MLSNNKPISNNTASNIFLSSYLIENIKICVYYADHFILPTFFGNERYHNIIYNKIKVSLENLKVPSNVILSKT